MADKCKYCGEDQAKYPLFVDEQGKPLGPELTRKKLFSFQWKGMQVKNLFKIEARNIIMFAIIFFMVWAYEADIKQYEDIKDNPCGFCANAGSACGYVVYYKAQGTSAADWQGYYENLTGITLK